MVSGAEIRGIRYKMFVVSGADLRDFGYEESKLFYMKQGLSEDYPQRNTPNTDSNLVNTEGLSSDG